MGSVVAPPWRGFACGREECCESIFLPGSFAQLILVLCVGAGTVSAVQPYQEYRKLIESAQNLTALRTILW
ncbi:hypothetical protein [Stenotrophomonas sp. S11A1a]|uniref:hypothetical protein n=1 Tax=Stenotrophomonas sp. S11A1a TaxID=3455011 RepID=UPI003F7A4083